ncbi:MAG: cell division protein ZapA [bacterium]|nr:cell division protein ZapA [bacterium]
MTDILQDTNREDAVEVTIFDRAYRLRRTAEPAYLLKVATLVDERMKNVHSSDRTRPAGELAVLAALQLAHELSEAQAELNDREKLIRTKTRDIERALDDKLRELGV